MAVGWHRKSGKGALTQRVAEDALNALRVGVLVLDAGDQPVLVNPAAVELGLVRGGPAPQAQHVHAVIRTLAAQVRRSGARREVELDLPRRGSLSHGTAE